MINQIKINGMIFKENCILKIKDENFHLRFIEVGINRFTIELQSVDDPKTFQMLGEQTDGRLEINEVLFHADLISEN